LSSGEANPSSVDFFAVKLLDGTGSFILVIELNNGEAGATATLHIDCDVLLFDVEALEELDKLRLTSCPWKASQLDAAIYVVFVHAVAATHISGIRVPIFEVVVLFNFQVE